MSLGEALPDFVYREKRTLPSFSRNFRRLDNDNPDSPWRFTFLYLLVLVAFLILLANLIRVQIFEGSYYRSLSDNNRIRSVTIHAPRGIIFDRNDTPLVSNLPAFRLTECRFNNQCQSQTISKNQAIDLEAAGLQSGQSLEIDSVRSYLYALETAHLLGYVTEINASELAKDSSYSLGDRLGRGGVEEQYQSRLRGKDGRELVEVDAVGKKLRSLSTTEPTPGEDLRLTIDLSLQKAAWEAIKDEKAAVVATNPNTGEILTLASSPSFNPNTFTDLSLSPADREKDLEKIFNDSRQPLFDRAISGTYPPGSNFKIVTATAGLENGRITEATVIDDPGVLVIGPYKFPNWLYLRNGGTQGVLNVVGAIQKSNDIFFYKVGEWVGVDGLADWALKYNLSKKLGVDLPGESAGIFPTKDWRTAFARDWYLGDTYHLAIGQGDMLVTPLQNNAWTSVIANGGKICRPHVLGGVSPACKSIGISNKTIQLIKQGMIEACSPGGTAWPLFDFKVSNKPIQIACKTGTAEFGDPKDRTHAWLTSFAPAQKPEIAVTVLIEAGGEGSDVAAPVVKKVMEAWFGR